MAVLSIVSGILGLIPLDPILRLHDLIQITPLHTLLQIWPKNLGAMTTLGVLFIIAATAYLILAYGSFLGRRWAWTLGVVTGAINVVFATVMISIGNLEVIGIIGLSPLSLTSAWLVFWGVSTASIVLYLTRGHSEIFFFEIDG